MNIMSIILEVMDGWVGGWMPGSIDGWKDGWLMSVSVNGVMSNRKQAIDSTYDDTDH